MQNGTTAIISRNGSHPGPVAVEEHDLLWDGLPPATKAKLGEPLDEGLVSHRKGRGGRTFAYIEGRAAIDQANRIFGFGGWGYDLTGPVELRESESVDAKTGETRHMRAYAATVRVTVPGSPSRTDVGFHAVVEETRKATRRPSRAPSPMPSSAPWGLRRAVGNSLYGDGAPGDVAPALRRTIVELGRKQGFDESQVRDAVRSRTGKDLDELPVAEVTSLLESMARKLQTSTEEDEPKAA